MDRSGTGRGVRRLAGGVLVWAPFLLVTFMACGGGAPADVEGGAGSDAGGADGQGSGGSDSDGNGSGSASSSGGLGGGDGSGGMEPVDLEPVDFEEFCEVRSELNYDYLAACYGSESFSEDSREAYVGRTTVRCLNAAEAIEAERLDYDATRAAACLAALEEVDCVAGSQHPACAGVFEGQSEPGDDCYAEETLLFMVGVSTCRDGYCAGDACPGTCMAFPATGETCSGWCQEGDYCDEDARCAPLPSAGEPCPNGSCAQGASCSDGTCLELTATSADTCDEDVLCAGPTVCDDGTCRSRVEVGGPCKLPIHCPSPSTCRDETCQLPGDEGSDCGEDAHCIEGLYCPWSDEVPLCTPFAPLGELCGGEEGVRCAPDQACIQGPEEIEARCRELVPEGESCADGFQLCEAGVFCSADLICEPPGAEGDSCWSVHPCEEGLGCHCAAEDTEACAASQQDDGDTCQPRVADGEPCFAHEECESGSCDLSVSSAPDEPGECEVYVEEVCLP